MSWQAYIDSSLLGTGKIDKAGIYSRAGDSTWAKSAGFDLSADELKAIARGFDDNGGIQGSGIKLQGEKYLTIRAEDRSIYGKKGNKGVIAVRTKQALVIGHYPESTQPGEAAKIVEALADYLIQASY
ncbi:profilin, required for normal timing of actin polymerization in response to thermal stress [Savitreella phatthalungensis]